MDIFSYVHIINMYETFNCKILNDDGYSPLVDSVNKTHVDEQCLHFSLHANDPMSPLCSSWSSEGVFCVINLCE